MKIRDKIFITIIITAFLSAFVFSMYYFGRVEAIFSDRSDSSSFDVAKPEYHFVLVAQNTEDPFWQSVKSGALKAGKEFNAAVEFNGPRFNNIDEELQYLDIAIASRVDGIATHVLDEDRFTPIINKAVDMKIPVITVEDDAKKSKRTAYIGISNFQLGVEGGKLLAKGTNGKAQVAVVLNSFGNALGNVTQNLRISGISDAIKNFGNGIEIKVIRTSYMGILGAGEVTNEIINEFPNINAIVCTSTEDTIGAAQVIVDLNKVGNITIIGYGDLPEILRYVEKGVIFGTVVSNPTDMGYQSIKSLVEIKMKNGTSAYVDTGVQGISQENLKEYKKLIEQKKGGEPSK